jgi:HSP20 family protein
MATKASKPTETPGKEVSQAPKSQFLSPFDEFDQLVDDFRRNWMQPFFLGRNWPEAASVFGGRMPKVDLIDRDTEYCVRAELPGVSKDSLNVTLEESTLTLGATFQKDEQEEKGQYHRRETSRGEFKRVIQLPGAVDSDKVTANFKDGILELRIPKAPGAKRQFIKVE